MNHSRHTTEKIRTIVGSREAAFNSNWAAGAITENEARALARAIKFVNAEQWQDAGLRIPLRPTGAVDDRRGRRAKLYIIQYSMRTYGLLVMDDLPNTTYSAWLESTDPSPVTGKTVSPLFYWSVNGYVRQVTAITPREDLRNGILAGRGLGDDGQGGDRADNGFFSGRNRRGSRVARAYWPMYLRGILLGGVMPYDTVAFRPPVRSAASQVVNGQHTPDQAIVKVARHNDDKLHGWVPGDVQVRWELQWRDVDQAITTQAGIEMRQNDDAREGIALQW